MKSRRDALYRLHLAEGFLGEAEQDYGLERWRAAVDKSQLTVENSARAALALVLPPSRVHDAGRLLTEALEQDLSGHDEVETVEVLAACAGALGPEVHIQTDCGDETGGLTLWELFGREDAKQALEPARQATESARRLVATGT